MTQEIYDELAKTLAQVRQSYGADVMTNRRRLNGVLADRLPENKRDIRVLLDAIDDGALSELESVPNDQVSMQVDRLATRMESNRGTRHDLAQHVIAACAYALGVSKLPSEMFGRFTPEQTPSQNRQDDWVGVSEPVRGTTSHSGGQVGGETGGTVTAFGFIDGLKAKMQGKEKMLSGIALALGVLLLAHEFGAFDGVIDQSGSVQVSFPAYDQDLGYFGEFAGFDIAPTATLQSPINGLTPQSIIGAETVSTQQILDQGGSVSDSYAFIDAFMDQHDAGIPGAYLLSYAGAPGSFADETQTQLAQDLETITNGKKAFPLIFYTKNVARWDGYNAALRATQAGYLNVFWYRGGMDSWSAANQETQLFE